MKFLQLIFALPIAVSTQLSAQGIQFDTSSTFQQVLQQASSQKKIVFIDAYTTWCGPCRWMDKTVFPATEVGNIFNANFVNVKIDMEKGEGKELAKKYNIHAYPTYLFLNENGKLLHRVVGGMEAKDFITVGEDALKPEKQFGTLLQQYESGERSNNFLYNFAYVSRKAGEDSLAKVVAMTYLKQQTNLLEQPHAKLLIDFTTSADEINYTLMRTNAKEFTEIMGADKYNAKMYNLAYQTAQRNFMIRPDMTKHEVWFMLKESRRYFKRTLPAEAKKLQGRFAIKAHATTKDLYNYGKATIRYYDAFPSTDVNELNSIAWNFFEVVKNKNHLQAALKWALHSVEIAEGYGNLDTVANLYNKLGDKQSARIYAKKAIAKGKAEGQDVSGTEKLLTTIGS